MPKPILAGVQFGGLKTWPNLPTRGGSSPVRVALFVESLTLVLKGRRLLWLEVADVTMGNTQDAKCDLSTLNLSRGR